MTPNDHNWRPSRQEQRVDWYLSRLLRLLGSGMIVWELAVDSGKNPLVLLMGGMLATARDAISTGAALIKQAKVESKELDKQIDAQLREEPRDESEV